jgi:hypothetical protein
MKPLLALCLAATMFAGQIPAPPMPAPEPPPQKVVKKKGGKKKWIILAAVAAGTVAVLVVANARLGNEGKGIF